MTFSLCSWGDIRHACSRDGLALHLAESRTMACADSRLLVRVHFEVHCGIAPLGVTKRFERPTSRIDDAGSRVTSFGGDLAAG